VVSLGGSDGGKVGRGVLRGTSLSGSRYAHEGLLAGSARTRFSGRARVECDGVSRRGALKLSVSRTEATWGSGSEDGERILVIRIASFGVRDGAFRF